jgi:hypothetical protein
MSWDLSWDLGDEEANSTSMKGCPEFLHGGSTDERSDGCFEKTCGSPTSEGGKAER